MGHICFDACTISKANGIKDSMEKENLSHSNFDKRTIEIEIENDYMSVRKECYTIFMVLIIMFEAFRVDIRVKIIRT